MRVIQQILGQYPGVNLFEMVGVEMPPPTEIWTDDVSRGERILGQGMTSLKVVMAWVACVQGVARMIELDGELDLVVGWSEIQPSVSTLRMHCMGACVCFWDGANPRTPPALYLRDGENPRTPSEFAFWEGANPRTPSEFALREEANPRTSWSGPGLGWTRGRGNKRQRPGPPDDRERPLPPLTVVQAWLTVGGDDRTRPEALSPPTSRVGEPSGRRRSMQNVMEKFCERTLPGTAERRTRRLSPPTPEAPNGAKGVGCLGAKSPESDGAGRIFVSGKTTPPRTPLLRKEVPPIAGSVFRGRGEPPFSGNWVPLRGNCGNAKGSKAPPVVL